MSTTHPAPAQFFAFGGDNARGYSTHGDVLVNKTADGVDLNVIWDEANQVMSAWNRKRTDLATLISYPTIAIGDTIPQTIGGDHFEKES
ncbi:hypothetical protein [Gordonia desulfuricans]|uniref:hypothetical protein n=1 Tax=Gordonia desulfuricans TaxID=89051 RepID=UPI000AC2D5B9|nr:hypothetical protein [Gordonia desulfuricans]